MYRQSLTVMPSEASCTNEIKIRSLLNRLQDTASLAVVDLEGSPSELMRRGYAWVLLKYELEAARLPGMDEPVVVETRHTVNDGFHTLRAFRVFSASDESETLVLAKTSWVLIDLAAGRPVRASQRLPELFSGTAEDLPIDPEFAPIPRLSKLEPEGDALSVRETVFPVRFHDLDSNGHVNNAVYFEWAYEATPLDLLSWTLCEMRAEFRVSAKLGETAAVRVKEIEIQEIQPGDFPRFHKTAKGERAFVYEILGVQEDGSRTLARFYSVWTPLDLEHGGLAV